MRGGAGQLPSLMKGVVAEARRSPSSSQPDDLSADLSVVSLDGNSMNLCPSSTHVTAGINTTEEREKQATRRRCELELISRLDQCSIADPRKDCWYLMDSRWLTVWALYASAGAAAEEGAVSFSQTPAPGPVSSLVLLDPDGRGPRPGLQPAIDYRGVPSLVYFCFTELHGRDRSPEFPRHDVDIYKPVVRPERLVPIVCAGQTQARVLVDELRPQWVDWARNYSDDEDDDDDDGPPSWLCCCGLTREHLEALIYWAVRCCSRASRKRSGRKLVSYRAYKPMQYREGDSTRGFGDTEEDDASTTADSMKSSTSDGSVLEFGKNYSRPFFRLAEDWT